MLDLPFALISECLKIYWLMARGGIFARVEHALNCTHISWWPLTKTSDIDKKCLVKTNRKIFHSNEAGGLIGASFKQIYCYLSEKIALVPWNKLFVPEIFLAS